MSFSRIWDFGKRYVAQVRRDQATDLAAQLAYYFLLSLFPFLIFAITLLGYTPITVADVLGLIRKLVPGESLSLLQNALREVLETRKSGLLSFGILGTIWAASNALNAMIRALNRAYGVEETRSFLKTRAVAILLTLLMILAILVSLILPVFGEMLQRLASFFVDIPEVFFTVWSLVRWALSFCVVEAALVCIYYFAPNKRLRIREVIAGALFAGIGWQVISMGFSYYLGHFAHYSATYGSLGTFIILLVWFYLTALIIILGGELNAVLHAPDHKAV